VLDGRRIVVTGVLTKTSIAFAVAALAQLLGAEIVLTSFGRMRRITERAARALPLRCPILEFDVNVREDHYALRRWLEAEWGYVDGALHAIAYAPPDALGGELMRSSRESAEAAFVTSAYSFKALAETIAPLLERAPVGRVARGGRTSIVGLDFDASVAWPAYNWMGVSKAALESINRYLAVHLGPIGARVNLVSAGPLATTAAGGVPGFDRLAESWPARAPLGWDVHDPIPVARTVCFLLSDWSRGITGEVLYVDGGYRCVGMPAVEAHAHGADD
jgi:enoyl ACP reductase